MNSTRCVLGAVALLACGGVTTTPTGDGGNDATPDVHFAPESSVPTCTGCSLSVTTKNIDSNLCAPQLESTTTCERDLSCPIEPPCGYVVEVPCADDGGLPDAGPDQCADWCDAAAPDGVTSFKPLNCAIQTVDGGNAYFVTCGGGCGV